MAGVAITSHCADVPRPRRITGLVVTQPGPRDTGDIECDVVINADPIEPGPVLDSYCGNVNL